jgi:hypothetical protein
MAMHREARRIAASVVTLRGRLRSKPPAQFTNEAAHWPGPAPNARLTPTHAVVGHGNSPEFIRARLRQLADGKLPPQELLAIFARAGTRVQKLSCRMTQQSETTSHRMNW